MVEPSAAGAGKAEAQAEAAGSSSRLTLRWREMDSNHRFRVNGELSRRAVSLGSPAWDEARRSKVGRLRLVCRSPHPQAPSRCRRKLTSTRRRAA